MSLLEEPPHKIALKLLLVVLVLTAPPLGWLYYTLTRGEVRLKSEWAALQAAEEQFRLEPVGSGAELKFHQIRGHRLLGVPSADGEKRVWVLMNPVAKPLYKQLPGDVPWSLTSAQLQKVLESGKVDPGIEPQIRSRVR